MKPSQWLHSPISSSGTLLSLGHCTAVLVPEVLLTVTWSGSPPLHSPHAQGKFMFPSAEYLALSLVRFFISFPIFSSVLLQACFLCDPRPSPHSALCSFLPWDLCAVLCIPGLLLVWRCDNLCSLTHSAEAPQLPSTPFFCVCKPHPIP